jgi:predicted DCC family thiol-disulfide oxidoreductase YuxK
MNEGHWVLWDGDCGFCGRIVAWSQRRDTEGEFEFVAYQQAPSPPMDAALEQACARAVHVVRRDGVRLRGGRACLFVLGRLGWPRTAALLAWPPLVWGVEAAYWIVARNRQLFSRLLFRRATRDRHETT